MCWYLYLASDYSLPLKDWTEESPAFNVAELQDYDMAVIKQFSKPFIVFLGAHTGCSCGFMYDSDPIENDRDEVENEDARESVARLVDYLTEQLQRSSLELFGCWNGDQGERPQHINTVTTDYFIATEFPKTDEPTLLRIEKVSCPTL